MIIVSAAGSLVALGVGTGQRARSASMSAPPALPGSSTNASRSEWRGSGSGLQAQGAPAARVGWWADSAGNTHLVSILPESDDGAPIQDSNSLGSPSEGVSGMDAAAERPDDGARRDLVEKRMFDGRPVRAARTVRMKVTAYSPDERSCGASADGITASGHSVLTNGGFLVAADPKVLPLGSLVSVPGYDEGAVVPVLDVGGAIKGNRLDVLFPTHAEAMRWGVQTIDVTVWEYDDGRASEFKRVRRKTRGDGQ
ncbi:MAG: 3D domain-containing protein [Phycisphaerales bacterium]